MAFQQVGERKCAVCGATMNWIKPGVSKTTGNPYDGFYACSSGRRCKQPKNLIQTPTAPRSPQLPTDYEYQEPIAVKPKNDQLLIEQIESVRRECRDFFSQIDEHQTDTFKKLCDIETFLKENLGGNPPF